MVEGVGPERAGGEEVLWVLLLRVEECASRRGKEGQCRHGCSLPSRVGEVKGQSEEVLFFAEVELLPRGESSVYPLSKEYMVNKACTRFSTMRWKSRGALENRLEVRDKNIYFHYLAQF